MHPSPAGVWSDDIWMGRELFLYAAQPPNPDDPADPSHALVAALQASRRPAPRTRTRPVRRRNPPRRWERELLSVPLRVKWIASVPAPRADENEEEEEGEC
jgi:hypothetical protein